MNNFKDILFTYKKYVLCLILLFVLAIYGFYKSFPQEKFIEDENVNSEFEIETEAEIINKKIIYVHIDGAVIIPGIKEVEEGTRIFELIEIAGGLAEDADISKINLASVLKDEQKIIVPYIVKEVINNSSSNTTSAKSTKANKSQLPININYATFEEFQLLNGIGPSMAQKIIDYREENGFFNSIEDIKNVSGIGEAKFNKIKDDIVAY